ncbi:MAG: phytoene desaturase family protein [Bacillota bacterium]
MAKNNSVAVIGAGLGGLSAAIRLAYKGYDVHLFEKNNSAGGKAGNLQMGNYRFDTGPSLLTLPFILEELFCDVDEDINDYIEIQKLKILCRYFYPDGTVLNAYSENNLFANEVSLKTRDTKEAVYRYFNYCRRIYELTSELFLKKPFTELSTFFSLSAIKSLINVKSIDAFRNVHQANQSFFEDPRTVQLFDRYATYNGSNPYLSPATLNIIAYVENILGGYYASEGIYSIPTALERLAREKGVKIYFNTPVEKIIITKGEASGVRINGKDISFDVVISNCDSVYTNIMLLKGSKYHKVQEDKAWREKSTLSPSTSAIVFYWAVEAKHSILEAHNILFSEDYAKEFNEIFNKKICPADPTVYIYISSKLITSDAPENCENWFVMINVPENSGQDWQQLGFNIKEKVIVKIEKMLGIDIRDKIVMERVLTPKDIEDNTNSWQGSLYGPASNSRLSAFKRQSNRSSKYKGLFYTGGSAHPGGGIPLVILSGKITSELIEKYHRSKKTGKDNTGRRKSINDQSFRKQISQNNF